MELEIENAAPALPAAQATPEPVPPTSFQDRALTFPIPARYTPNQGGTPFLCAPWGSAGSGGWNGEWAGPVGEVRHPVHREWTEADFERLWRFDENRDMTRDIDDWSHPAHRKSVIPPASQTSVVWWEKHSDAAITEVPPTLRCDEFPQLDFGPSTRKPFISDLSTHEEFDEVEWSKREVERICRDYEKDWRTEAERDALLFNNRIRKSKYPDFPSGERIKTNKAQHYCIDSISGFNERARIQRLDSKPSDHLIAEWEENLKEYKLGKLELPPKEGVVWTESFEGEEDEDEHPTGMRVIDEGVTVTTAAIPERKKEHRVWAADLGAQGLTIEEWDGPSTEEEKEKFKTVVALNLMTFENRTREEAMEAAGLKEISPNTFSKRVERVGDEETDIDWTKVENNYYCIVRRNNRSEVMVLAPASASAEVAYKAFRKKMRAAQKQARLKERRKGGAGIRERELEATLRVENEYAQAEIWCSAPGRWHPGGFTVVTFLPNSRGI